MFIAAFSNEGADAIPPGIFLSRQSPLAVYYSVQRAEIPMGPGSVGLEGWGVM